MNRICTNPLEHSLGVVRMLSKDHHNAQCFIKEVNYINSLRKLREEMILDVVRHRELQFGRVIIKEKRQINVAHVTQYVDVLVDEGNTGCYSHICKQIHSYFNEIIEANTKTKEKCIICKNTGVMLSPTNNILIQKRQFQNVNACNCKWTIRKLSYY